MGDLIETRDLGYSVYGTAQVDYTIDGEEGCSYDLAVARAGLRRSVAVEQAIPAYTAAVRARQRKVEDLGTALADIAATFASFTGDDRKVDSTTSVVGGTQAYEILSKYGLASYSEDDKKVDYFSEKGKKIAYGNVQKLQAEIKYALDIVNNDMQQDVATLQSLVSKRDNAYQMAGRLMKKANQTRSTGIRYIQ